MQLGDVFTSLPLTQISLAYKNDGYIAELIAPIVQVKNDTGKIYSYDMSNLRIYRTKRSVGGKGFITETNVSSASHYVLEDHVIGEFIPEEIILNAESPLKPRSDITEALTDRLLVEKEKALADVLTSSSYLTKYTTLSGTSQWSDYTNSDPLGDVDTAISTVRQYSGKIPNTLIISWDVLQKLRFHPDIRDFFPGATNITSDMLKNGISNIFGIPNMLVGKAQYNSVDAGQTDTLGDIWTKDVVVAYIEPTPSLKSRSLAFTYSTGTPRSVQLLGQGQGGLETIQRKSEYIQVSDKYDQVLVDAYCGYLIEAAIA